MNKKTIVYFIVFISIAISFSFIACLLSKKYDEKISIGANITLPEIKAIEMVNDSDAIVLGVVRSSKTSKYNIGNINDINDIKTDYTIDVEKYISNKINLQSREVTIQTIGGSVGNQTINIQQSPIFKNGERVIVIIKRMDKDIFNVYGWSLGKYTVDEEENIGVGEEIDYFQNIFGNRMNLDDFEKFIQFASNKNLDLWNKVVWSIENCKVKQIMQTHENRVTINLKDRSTIEAFEPQIDDVFNIEQSVRNKCGNIIMATE